MSKIEVNNLKFSYNNKDEAIQDLSLTIEAGAWVCIVGHNGSGKSTLAKLLIGLLKADSGEIIIDGIKLSKETLHDVRKRVGIVFQNPDNQFVGVTVKHDIAFGLENQCVPQKEMIELVNEYANKVGMSEYLDKEPHQLSGGQKTTCRHCWCACDESRHHDFLMKQLRCLTLKGLRISQNSSLNSIKHTIKPSLPLPTI